ncbi:MAG: SRPBCC family protein [Pseudomonadota bacterium]
MIFSNRQFASAGMLALLPLSVYGAELRSIDVTHDDGVYKMISVTWIDAPVQGVFDVLTDYDEFERLSSIYDEAHYLELEDDASPKVYTRVEGCVWFYCQTMERTEVLTNLGVHCIRAVADPDESDFHSSDATWQLHEVDGGTEVHYAIVMEPDFFIPPLIGPYVLKKRLRNGGSDAIDRIESFAQASEADMDTFRERGLNLDAEPNVTCEDWLTE